MFNLFTKTLYDKRAFIIGWGVGLAFLGFLMMIFYPAFHQDSSIDQLVKSLPPAFQGLVGDLANLKELPGYVGSQLFEVRIPIFVSILSIILAVGLTVGEEEKGQLRTVAALPLSRSRILMSKWLAIVVISFVTTFATIIGVEIGLAAIGEMLDPMVVLRLSAMMWLLSVSIATLVFGLGLASGRRGLTMGLGIFIAVGSFILTTFAKSVDWLQPYEYASLLHYFPATTIANNEIGLVDVVVLGGVALFFLLIGLIFFRRRDIR